MRPAATAIHSAAGVWRMPSSSRFANASGIGHRIGTDELGHEDRLAAGNEAGAHFSAQHLEDAVVVAEHLRTEVVGGDLQSRVAVEPVDEILDAGNELLVERIKADLDGDVHGN